MRFLIAFLSQILFVAAFTIPSNAQFIRTYAGNGTGASAGDGLADTLASFNHPSGAFRDHLGNLYIVEYTGNKIRKVDNLGIVSTFAGTGVPGSGGDGGPATAAQFNTPIDIVQDHVGNFYISDNVNQKIRKIDTAGIITTFAGTGVVGYTGDGGPATAATMRDPDRLAVDAADNIYFADADNNVIRMIDVAGIIHTVAGNGSPSFSGDGGPATAAGLWQPLGVAIDANGNMYIADGQNSRIRKVDHFGIISTWAGNGAYGISGDGGPADSASMEYPDAVAVDASCNVYFTDWYGQRVRKITSTDIISTVVGTGAAGFYGDGGLAINAQINGPDNLTFDNQANLYIPDFYNNRIRQVLKIGDTTGCPPTVPVASFAAADSTVCLDSCLTFTSTSIGTIDSVRWTAAGESISTPTTNSTSICFTTTGSVTVHFYTYGAGGEDSSSEVITVTNCHPSGIITGSINPDNFWISQLNDYSVRLNSSQLLDNKIAVAVYDMKGCKILYETWSAGTYSLEINSTLISPGLYIIKLGNGKVFKWSKQ